LPSKDIQGKLLPFEPISGKLRGMEKVEIKRIGA